MGTSNDNRTVVLIVDDEPTIVEVLRLGLQNLGYATLQAASGPEALAQIRRHRVDLVLLDLRLGADSTLDGCQTMAKIKETRADLPVIVVTAYSTVETVVKAIKQGACDFVCKPFMIGELHRTIKTALKECPPVTDPDAGGVTRHFGVLIGDSGPMRKVYRMIEKCAPTDIAVLIEGESGTGKELVARAIHTVSRRRHQDLVPLNCSAVPENLLESEMFGYVAGAFTGAALDRRGLFLAAHRGTLFLDEIGVMDPGLQKKLLRALQEGQVRRVGETRDLEADVRILAATNESLEDKVRQGSFREDLYYRINVIQIRVPPLRERKADLKPLTDFFLNRQSVSLNRNIEMKDEVMPLLERHHWPGNVRELQNAIACAAALCSDGTIAPTDLPPRITEASAADHDHDQRLREADIFRTPLRDFLKFKEQEYIDTVLRKVDGNRARAASVLGISRATFYHKYENQIEP